MVKKCRVLINNEAVTVFRYDGYEVQVPSIHKEANMVNVILKDGIYKIVDDDYVESEVKAEKKYIRKEEPKKVKKTTKSVKEETFEEVSDEEE